jgi:hypothetical protein
VRRHAPGCNGTVIAFSCTTVGYPLCGCGDRCLVDLWRRHKRPFFRGFLAGSEHDLAVNRRT